MTYDYDRELQSLRARWKEHLDELHLLFDIAKDINFIRNLDVLLDQIVDRTVRVMRAEGGSLLLLNPETQALEFSVVKGANSDAIRDLNIALRPGEGIAGWVAVSNQHALVNDPQGDMRFKREVDWMTDYRTRNILAVPMRTQGRTVGVIEVMNRQGGKDFTEFDAEFLTSIAWLAGSAIANAQVYEDLESSREFLHDILESIPSGFIGVNMKSVITHFNGRAQEMLGLRGRSLVGVRYTQALSGYPEIMDAIERAFAENRGDLRRRAAALIPVRGPRELGYSTLPIADNNGNAKGFGIIFQDITDFNRT